MTTDTCEMELASPIHTHFDKLHGILSVYLTNTCNITCRHCGVNSGPTDRSRLEVQTLLNEIPEWTRAGILKGLQISGGEPFLLQYDLRDLAALCAEHDLLCAVNTNAFWARNPTKAEAILRSLPGITQLLVSTDVYHEEFIPLVRIRNAIRAGLKANLVVYVSVCTAGGTPDAFVERLRVSLESEFDGKVLIGVNRTEPFGRASQLPEARLSRKSAELPIGRCKQVNRPLVMPNGDVFACCNTNVPLACPESPLKLGTLRHDTLDDLYHKARSSVLIQAIRSLGPRFLAELAKRQGVAKELETLYPEGDICSLCIDLMSKRTVVHAILRASESPETQREVAIACAVELGETTMLTEVARNAQESENNNYRPSREKEETSYDTDL